MMGGVVAFGMSLLVFVWDGPSPSSRTPSTPPIPSSRTRASAIRDLDTRTERLLPPQCRRPGRASAIRDLDTRTERLLRPQFRRPGRAQARSGTSTPEPNAFYIPHPDSTDKILEKISPFGIRLLNKRELPGPFPPFQRLFPRYCALHCLVLFVPDQPIDPVLSCESG